MHIDDFGIATSNKTLMMEVFSKVREIYQCKVGDLDFYLGMKITRDRVKRTITASQPRNHWYQGAADADGGQARRTGVGVQSSTLRCRHAADPV